METEHFQAAFKVITTGITLGSIQIENNQIEKHLLSNLLVICQLKYRLKMMIQTDRFRESGCQHCRTAVLVEKNLAAFLTCHLGIEGKVLLFSFLEKNLNILW